MEDSAFKFSLNGIDLEKINDIVIKLNPISTHMHFAVDEELTDAQFYIAEGKLFISKEKYDILEKQTGCDLSEVGLLPQIQLPTLRSIPTQKILISFDTPNGFEHLLIEK